MADLSIWFWSCTKLVERLNFNLKGHEGPRLVHDERRIGDAAFLPNWIPVWSLTPVDFVLKTRTVKLPSLQFLPKWKQQQKRLNVTITSSSSSLCHVWYGFLIWRRVLESERPADFRSNSAPTRLPVTINAEHLHRPLQVCLTGVGAEICRIVAHQEQRWRLFLYWKTVNHLPRDDQTVWISRHRRHILWVHVRFCVQKRSLTRSLS